MKKALPENRVKRLHQEFVYFKKYSEKLKFLDDHFNIIPFSFPSFDPDIAIFFGPQNLQVLNEIWQMERQSSALLTKEFDFDGRKYVFDVNFVRPHRTAVNDFIIEKFLSAGHKEIESALKIILKKYSTPAAISNYLNCIDETIQFLTNQTKTTADRSSKMRFINVFISGLNDSLGSQNTQVFSASKKFIELYLYSQGKLYAKFINKLREIAIVREAKSSKGTKLSGNALSKQKILLLKQLRIIDAVQLQYPNLAPSDKMQKIAEIISFLIGETDTKFIFRQLNGKAEKKILLPIRKDDY